MIFYVFIVNKFSTHLIESFLVACNGDKEDVEIETKIWNFVTILEFSKCYHSIHFVCKFNPFTRHLAFFCPSPLKSVAWIHHFRGQQVCLTLGWSSVVFAFANYSLPIIARFSIKVVIIRVQREPNSHILSYFRKISAIWTLNHQMVMVMAK